MESIGELVLVIVATVALMPSAVDASGLAHGRGEVVGADREFGYLTESQGSSACPNEALRTGISAALPECRAYELVTLAAKNGAVFGLGFAIPHPSASEDGDRVIAHSIQPLGGAQAGTANRQLEGEPYALNRTSSGWTITPLAPAASEVRINTEFGEIASSGAALFSGPTPPREEDDFYVRRPDGTFLDVGPAYPASFGAAGVPVPGPAGFTADLSHLLYEVSASLEWPFDATLNSSHPPPTSLYEYVGAGNSEPVLVGVNGGPLSESLISTCGTIAGSRLDKIGDIASDGEVVFFMAVGHDTFGCPAGATAPATDQLYARVEASETIAISQRSAAECTTNACKGSAAGDAEFVGASEDGSRVFFLDNQQLTDSATEGSGSATEDGCARGAGCNLYLYDFAQPEGHRLIAVSAGDTSGQGPRVQGVMAVAPDGSHVYFVARGVLSATANGEGATAEAGAENLYVYERDARYPEGHVAFIAVLAESDAEEWLRGPLFANVTPDGRFMVFTSHADLTPDDTSPSDAAQVFRYDAESEELIRVSVGERGYNDNGNAGAGDASIVRPVEFRSDPTMSHDGSRVFFQSPVGLTPQALNMLRIGTLTSGAPSYAQNVYEYHEGSVYLISDGRDTASVGEGGESAVRLIGSDAAGENVFFSTIDRLVPQDTDTQLDYYDARIDGGFAAPRPAVECEGEACQGAPPAGQAFAPLTSTLLAGAGNLAPSSKSNRTRKPKRCRKGKKRVDGKCVPAARRRRGGRAESPHAQGARR